MSEISRFDCFLLLDKHRNRPGIRDQNKNSRRLSWVDTLMGLLLLSSSGEKLSIWCNFICMPIRHSSTITKATKKTKEKFPVGRPSEVTLPSALQWQRQNAELFSCTLLFTIPDRITFYFAFRCRHSHSSSRKMGGITMHVLNETHAFGGIAVVQQLFRRYVSLQSLQTKRKGQQRTSQVWRDGLLSFVEHLVPIASQARWSTSRIFM